MPKLLSVTERPVIGPAMTAVEQVLALWPLMRY